MKPDLALALIIKRYGEWQQVAPYKLPYQQEAERQNLLKLYTLYKKMKKQNSDETKVQVVTAEKPSYSGLEDYEEEKICQGNNSLSIYMKSIKPEHYFDYIRMDVETYNELFELIENKIKKQFLIKYPISAHKRLQITLIYLATGNSMTSISTAFQVASNTVSKIVKNTCEAIWDVLHELVLPSPNEEFWKQKALNFEYKLGFPHCLGVITKKQLVLQIPATSESNYCKSNEVLTFYAITDANSCFSLINIGFEKTFKEQILFSESTVSSKLKINAYNIPPASKISKHGQEFPFVFVGDKDFPLTSEIMCSYKADNNLDMAQQMFNYTINNMRESADNSFKILTTQWKIFQKKFSTNAFNTIKITKAAVCLHNFLMKKEILKSVQNKSYALLSASDLDKTMNELGCSNIGIYSEHSEDSTIGAEDTRNMFKELFFDNEDIIIKVR